MSRTIEEVVSDLKYITNEEDVYYGLDEILEIHNAEQQKWETMKHYEKYISALRKCADEHVDTPTS